MSIVVGVYDPINRKAVLGTDSIVVNGYTKHTNAIKGHLIRGLAWGFTGEAAQSQRAVRFLWKDTQGIRDEQELENRLYTLHEYLLATGTTAKDDKPATSLIDCLVASPWGIFHLCSGGSVDRHDWFAIGAGDDIARGAIFVTYNREGIAMVAERALEAACALSIYCSKPLQFFFAEPLSQVVLHPLPG